MSNPVVVAENLTRRYGYRIALKKITFTIDQGGIHGLFGANGAGKTTLMRIIATLLRPHEGKIRVFDFDPEEQPIEIRRKLGLIGDKPLLYPELSARENLHFFGSLYGMQRDEIETQAEKLASRFGVKSWLDEPTKNLSTGLRKRFDIIRTVLHDPELLLLDEPYAGLDIESMEIFSEYLMQVREGKTAILTTHNIALGSEVSDSFLTLRKGEIIGQGKISEFDGKL